MIELETRVRVPFLWGKSVFKKSRWSQINLIVGPNGSGKTILATELTKQFEAEGQSVKFISAERFFCSGIAIDSCERFIDKVHVRDGGYGRTGRGP